MGSAVGCRMLSEQADWEPHAVRPAARAAPSASEAFRIVNKSFTVSAAFLALVLGMTLMGPAPAALLGVLSMVFSGITAARGSRGSRTSRRTPSSRSSAPSRST